MSTDRDTTRIVRSWLSENEHESADRVLDAVLDALETTPQRRATWWPVRRLPVMNTIVKFGLAAAVVAVAVLLGLNYLTAPNVGSGGLDDPTPTAEPTDQATATPIPMLTSVGDLAAGTYRANASIPIDVFVTVPDGWIAGGDWVITGPNGPGGPDGMAIRFGSVRNLFANPFDSSAGLLDPPVGPTVDDLVDAMVSHPDWVTTSTPNDTTIDGYAGQHVRLTLPADMELRPDGRFMLFRDEASGEHWAFEPGQIFDFYMVDVDGERLVLELISYPDTSAEDLAAREAIVDGLQIEPRNE